MTVVIWGIVGSRSVDMVFSRTGRRSQQQVYILRLKKALYGLDDGPKRWLDAFQTHLVSIGGLQHPSEP